jgi:hypothetical protein
MNMSAKYLKFAILLQQKWGESISKFFSLLSAFSAPKNVFYDPKNPLSVAEFSLQNNREAMKLFDGEMQFFLLYLCWTTC